MWIRATVPVRVSSGKIARPGDWVRVTHEQALQLSRIGQASVPGLSSAGLYDTLLRPSADEDLEKIRCAYNATIPLRRATKPLIQPRPTRWTCEYCGSSHPWAMDKCWDGVDGCGATRKECNDD